MARWQHVKQFFDEDGINRHKSFRAIVPSHRETHEPKGFVKIRVLLAAPVFSLRVGLGMGALVAGGDIGSCGLATAEFLIAINDLFDALNGDMETNHGGRTRGPMTRTSGHIEVIGDIKKN